MVELIGAFIYRWRGQSHPYKKYTPNPVTDIVFTAPYAAATYLFYIPLFGWEIALLPTFVVWLLSMLGCLTGHGRGIDLGDTDVGEPERLEFLVSWAKPRLPLYWYDMLLLSVTGLAVTLPAGIATLNPVLAASGALKGPAYGVGKIGCPASHTEAGELLTGAALWCAVFLTLWRF